MTTCSVRESASKDETFATIQLNADCLDDVPPDYETSVGGPHAIHISGASEITVNESLAVMDPAGGETDRQQLHPDEEIELQGGESQFIAWCKFKHHTFVT